MIINEISFHDSQILKVIENAEEQIIDFHLHIATDWEKNTFENKILRFKNVTFYSLEEIPFYSFPSILNIIDLEKITKDFSGINNEWEITQSKIKIETTAGNRIVEFSDCEFI